MDRFDYKIADISLHEWGRKEIELAEVEMPGLMACRTEYGPKKVFSGVKISGYTHMCIKTAVLIETLKELGAELRWASCNALST
jgi:adenosylhomocysteinase